jgi:succinate dehydrogenase / fumarate reductase cytochrome b subunit
MSSAPKPRPKYYELNIAHHWAPAVLSIFHRISGFLLFFPLLPALLYLLQSTTASEEGYLRWSAFFAHPLAKLAMLGALWLYAHHFWAGLRYLLLDIHWGTGKERARASALAVFALGLATTVLIGWRLW